MTNRSMAPREHGAYGQLFAPIGAAIFSGHFSLANCFCGSGMCAFYAHEPWLILIGQRGPRATRELLGPAKRRLAAFVGACLGFGVVGLIGSDHEARWAGVIVGVSGASLLMMDRFEISGSTLGEVWAGAVLSCLGIPIGLAGGLPLRLARRAIVLGVSFRGRHIRRQRPNHPTQNRVTRHIQLGPSPSCRGTRPRIAMVEGARSRSNAPDSGLHRNVGLGTLAEGVTQNRMDPRGVTVLAATLMVFGTAMLTTSL